MTTSEHPRVDENEPPFLSIVLPCYGVQAFLRQCLDSILEQSFRDIEVIGIDDASPDHSGQILDEYAERDGRLRVIHLDENVGLGGGRNVGLDEARGDYVLFVDSDDWLADGALEAIAHRLRHVRPDVLFFDYARAYWDGRKRRNVLDHLLREPPPPDVFELGQRPSVMQIMMTAWNKAFRTDFLRETGLRFAPGYYEDLVVTYPILMLADRISLLDRVCYYYRQRRAGAITKTVGDKHFTAFDQYERIFGWMDEHGPEVDRFRPLMFERALWHLLIILRNRDRVPGPRRREFFQRMSSLYRRFVPPGYEPSTTDRLIQLGWWRAFQIFDWIGRMRGQAERASRRAVRKLRKLKSKIGHRVRDVQYRLALRQPVREDLAVFAAYWYRAPTGNPLAIYDALRRLAPDVEAVWVVRSAELERVPADIPYVVDGSGEYYRLLARAKYFVNNVNFPNFVVKRDGTVHVQTQHGTPLKTMGLDLRDYPVAAPGMNFPALLERASRWDYNLSSNRYSTEIWHRTYPCDFETLEFGYPRNDRYYTATAEEVRDLRQRFGIPEHKTAILYAPTHREYRSEFELQMDLSLVARSLLEDQVLLVRAHYFYDNLPDFEELEARGLIIDVSEHLHTEDVALASDVLLSDYSSIIFDYANLRRPIIVYADDYETYRRLRGTYIDFLEEPPGPVAATEQELIDVLRERGYEEAQMYDRLEDFRRRFCDFDDGRAAERVVRKVFRGEDPEPPRPREERTPAPAPRELRSSISAE